MSKILPFVEPTKEQLKNRSKKISSLLRLGTKKGFNLIKGSEVGAFERIPMNIPQVDDLFGPTLGRFAVAYGASGCGKSTATYRWLAAAQRCIPDRVPMLIDTEGRLDSSWMRAQGLDLDNLLIVEKQDTLEAYCDVALKAIATGDVSLLAIDTISAMMPAEFLKKESKGEMMERDHIALEARKYQQFIKMSKEAILKNNTACLFIGQARQHGIGSAYTHIGLSGGNMLRHMCLWIAQFSKLKGTNKALDIDGRKVSVPVNFVIKMKLEKDTGPNEGHAAFIEFIPGLGYDEEESKMRVAFSSGLINETAPSRFEWEKADGEIEKIHGKNNLTTFFKENPSEWERLQEKIIVLSTEVPNGEGSD